jgi:hypothetical protein
LFSANSRYIFNISKKTGIFTRVKMPVYRQSETSGLLAGRFSVLDVKHQIFGPSSANPNG